MCISGGQNTFLLLRSNWEVADAQVFKDQVRPILAFDNNYLFPPTKKIYSNLITLEAIHWPCFKKKGFLVSPKYNSNGVDELHHAER